MGPKRTFPSDITKLRSEAQLSAIAATASEDNKQIFRPPYSEMSQIKDELFLTGMGGISREKFANKNISCIINVTFEAPCVRLNGVETIRIPVDDTPNDTLIDHFDRIAQKIFEVGKKGQKTVVHCVAGMSRSATIVIAYLMKHYKMSLVDAFNLTLKKRSCIKPNTRFMKELMIYELRIHKYYSTRMIYTTQSGIQIEIPDFWLNYHPKLVRMEVDRVKNLKQQTKQ
ncbi:dual specificity protein phosphatase 14-like protein [Leptotrombidium deliense]|uniref:Dual specificity protein phosphatase 14-like protein n=1 Tax=Leptotrombidium deliense TaxID=299467 RepID=A0A443SSD0_9ACAR|nr:dual specificity protein phosphatase 14-like protein [Leptotrombidium deliense]